MTSVGRVIPHDVVGRERRLGPDDRKTLAQHHLEMPRSIRRPFGVGGGKGLPERRPRIHVERREAVAVVVRSDHHHFAHQIRPAECDQQGDDPAVTPAHEVRRAAHDLLQHPDDLGRHI
jgi:hypothetical protein